RGATAVTGADSADADALAEAAAALTDARQTEAARAPCFPDVEAPEVAIGAHAIVAESFVAAPARGGNVLVDAAHRVDEANRSEGARVFQRIARQPHLGRLPFDAPAVIGGVR